MPFEPTLVKIGNTGVAIDWRDGHRSTYPHRYLRLHCRCASCIEEWTKRPILDPNQVPADVTAIDHLMVGTYAVQFLFSDTHYTGIYTYDFLREICVCDECEARREKDET